MKNHRRVDAVKLTLQALEHWPATRDDDIELYGVVLKLCRRDPNHVTVAELAHDVRAGSVPSADAVMRARRRLQDQHRYLRGSSYESRQKHALDIRTHIRRDRRRRAADRQKRAGQLSIL